MNTHQQVVRKRGRGGMVLLVILSIASLLAMAMVLLAGVVDSMVRTDRWFLEEQRIEVLVRSAADEAVWILLQPTPHPDLLDPSRNMVQDIVPSRAKQTWGGGDKVKLGTVRVEEQPIGNGSTGSGGIMSRLHVRIALDVGNSRRLYAVNRMFIGDQAGTIRPVKGGYTWQRIQ